MLNSIYYTLKPLIPRRLQISLRRALVQSKRKKYAHVWPIDERAGRPPEGWTGWPEGKKFALVLTHDVESEKGISRCLPLAGLEEKLGFRSSFNFVAEDYFIPPDLPKTLKARGFEIGLHGLSHNGNLFRSDKFFRKKVNHINQYLREWGAVGFRSPSMYRNLEMIGDLETEYDSSAFDSDPFEPQPDGVGTIFPFWVGNNSNRKGYVELPYTLPQDHTLFIVLDQRDIEIWKRKLDWIASRGGMALMVVHPDYIALDSPGPAYYEYPVRFYEDFLKFIKTTYEGKYWQALPKEIAEYWKKEYRAKKETRKDSPVENLTVNDRKDRKDISLENRITKVKRAHGSQRVCFVYYAWFKGSAVLYREAKALQHRGFEVDIICLRGSRSEAKSWDYEGLKIYGIQARPNREKKTAVYFSRLGFFCLKSMVLLSFWGITRRYRLIHVTTPPDFLVFAGLFPKIMGAKIIMDIHDIGPELYMRKLGVSENARLVGFLRKMERIAARFSDHVITVTDIWREKLIQRSVKPSKCSVLMNVPDEKLFSPRTVSNFEQTDGQHFNIFYHGSLEEHFGVDTLLEAMPVIKEKVPQAQLYIYGTGRLLEDLKKIVKEEKMEASIHFCGMVPFYQVPEILKEADLGVVPTKDSIFSDEALSMKSLEYISLGVPIVISGTTVHRYYYDEEIVTFFKPGRVKDLAESVIWLAGNRERMARQVKNGKEFIREIGWEASREKYYRVVDDLIGKSNH